MLQWMAPKARERIRRGRIALLENPATSRAYRLDFLDDSDGIEDGLLADALFEFIVGDQCMLGQYDRASGMAFRDRTTWGTDASRLKEIVSARCDDSHIHQQVMGSYRFGPRSIHKAL